MKVRFFDKSIIKRFVAVVAFVSSVIGILAISFDIENKYKWIWAVAWIASMIVLYFVLYIIAINTRKASFTINGTKVNVYVGDIVAHDNGLNVIPVNEYYDTLVDDTVVSKKTLHGQYLLNICKDVGKIDTAVRDNLKHIETVKNRKVPNHQNRYELGSVIELDGYLLTAFTRFDKDNKAYLEGKDYFYFWGSFWVNLDKVFAGRTVNIPLFGSGMTRFIGCNLTDQELLETILMTMRKTGFKNKYHDNSVNIVIYKDNAKYIDFYHLKERFGD